jgi:hypothetical protein
MSNIKTVRDRFEATMKAAGYGDHHFATTDGEYDYQQTTMAWVAWQLAWMIRTTIHYATLDTADTDQIPRSQVSGFDPPDM